MMSRVLMIPAAAIATCLAVSAASAQWTRVLDVPAGNVFSVWANGDTIVAGADTLVHVSTNGGATWSRSSKPVADVALIGAVRIRNRRLYAGTFGQGVFISDNLGATWQAFNEGLVGGVLNSQLDLAEFQVRGDSLYAATLGAGVYVRGFAPAATWSHFGEEFEPNQASNVDGLTLGGSRLVAAAGGNGTVFFRDPGDAEWTLSWLDNVGLAPGLQAYSSAWTGSGWAVGTSAGVFHSVSGQEPWTLSGLNLGPVRWTAFATRQGRLFGAFDLAITAVIEHSGDDGATWQELESLPGVFVYQMAMSGSDLYAARADGLWRRPTATVSVAGDGRRSGLRFALAGPQPVQGEARLRFELPAAGVASIEVFTVAGRRVGAALREAWSAGTHEIAWNTRDLAPGVYEARLTAAGRQEIVRLVHLR